MSENNEKKENNDKEFKKEPTKDAFFADLNNIENELIDEAIELVKHALNLAESKFYDDAIEMLRQAMGLYDQIGRRTEVEAIKEKISDMYVKKEQAFRETEIKSVVIPEGILTDISIENKKEEEIKEGIVDKAKDLIEEGKKLVDIDEYEESLNKYEEAIKIYKESNNEAEIEKTYDLIDQCYNAQAKYQLKVKSEKSTLEIQPSETISLTEEEKIIPTGEEKPQKVKDFEEIKKKEEEISLQAYGFIEKASNAVKVFDFDTAFNYYNEAKNLFQSINWQREIHKIEESISDLNKEKERVIKELELKREGETHELEKKAKDEKKLEEKAKRQKETVRLEKAKKFEDLEKKKFEEGDFEKIITELVDKADKMARDYEVEIKKGKFEVEPPYQKVIEIYEEVYKKLMKKGWKEQAQIYTNQIKIYQEKLVKDKKLREIEDRKKQKKKVYAESLKVGRYREETAEKHVSIEEKRKEDETFKKEITERVDHAEKIAREYDLEIRKKNFNIESPYPKIIEIYEDICKRLIQEGWTDQLELYKNQIKICQEKLEKDKKLRGIELKKLEKDKMYLKSLKVEETKGGGDEKLKRIDERHKKDELFQKEISEMVDKAEKMSRNYDLTIRNKNFDEKCPYSEIIEIYEAIRKKLIDKNWVEQINIYSNQIKLYQEKLEKINKLKGIEAQKKEKEVLYKEALKADRFVSKEVDKMIILEQKRKEDEQFQSSINEMVNKAEKLERNYESEIKKGNLEMNPPFLEIIEIYEKIREKLIEKGWVDQANVYSYQINAIKHKIERNKKVQESEAKKKQKDKEYLESLKMKKGKEVDIAKLNILEEKYKEDNLFQERISDMVNKAENKAREYESQIRKGNFEIKCPYQEIIAIYKEICQILIEKKWNQQAQIYYNQIKLYEDKLEVDLNLHEIEKHKLQKQQEYNDLLKIKKEDKKLTEDLERLQDVEAEYKKALEEENFENQITELVNKADEMVRNYELAIRYGQFEKECIYPKVIEIYKDIKLLLSNKGWNQEAEIYSNQIKLYKEKLEHDKKLREIEAQKEKKYSEYLDSLKSEKLESEGKVKFKFIEVKGKKDELFEKEINELVDKAEKMARRYEFAIRNLNFEAECPYSEIIEIYNDVHSKILNKGWTSQAQLYKQQIKIYEEKFEKDVKLREIEAKKAKKEKEFEASFKAKTKEKPIKGEKFQQIELKKREQEALTEEAFKLIKEAENMVKKYELMLKVEILQTESPFDEVIELYKKARKIFIDNKWESEASKLITTIKFYKDKKEKDDKLRALEAKKIAKAETPIIAPEIRTKDKLLAKEKIALEFEKEKKEREESSNEAFEMIDEAEKLAKSYEFKLKEGVFMDCPYDQIIKIYREARKKFMNIGWEDQANKLISTINYYKEKLESDKKLRTLEAEKIEKQRKALEEQKRLTEKVKIEKDVMIKQKEKAIIMKSKEVTPFETQKEKAFKIMDQAKSQFNLRNFDLAIELYKESEDIFSNINWTTGINMVKESIQLIKDKKSEYESKLKTIEDKKIRDLKEEKEIDEELKKSLDLKKIEEDQKKKELVKIQDQKAFEKESSDRAYDLLEQGTKLLNRKKFDEAQNKYLAARDIFQKIGWFHEVSRINNELLLEIKKEESKIERLETYKKKKTQEEEELVSFLKNADQESKIFEKEKVKEKREKLKEVQISEKIENKIKVMINDANLEIVKFKHNEGIFKYKEAILLMQKLGWEKMISDVNSQIDTIKTKSQVPIIVLEPFPEDENKEKIKLAYESLDKAEMSLAREFFMKAISELTEATYILVQTKYGKKFTSEIDNKIKSLKEDINKKQQIEKAAEVKGEDKEPLDSASIEKEKALKLKADKIKEKESELKKVEDDFKARISAKKDARRERIKELMKKK